MPKKSAGLLLYRFREKQLQVFLVHPGGPFWAKKDAGAWSIPKGEVEEAEDLLAAAIRETKEETGVEITGKFFELTSITQKAGKIVYAWAVETDIDETSISSNTFEMEWPPKSNIKKSFPEIDRADWFSLPEAKLKILESQVPLVEELQKLVK